MNKIQNEGQWVDISAQLNSNFEQIETDILALQQTSWANKGYYYTEEDLLSAHPTSNFGDRAFVGSFYPYVIYLYTEDGWTDTGETGDAAELQLKGNVDKHEQQLANLETQLRIESDGSSETITDIHSNLETLNRTAQNQLSLSVLDNGNIVLSNALGESKEFMPATPSGDPMHYAYEKMGAVWNADSGFWEYGMANNEGVWMGLRNLSSEDIKNAYAANPSTTALMPVQYHWASCRTKPRFLFLGVLSYGTVGTSSLVTKNTNLEYVDNRFQIMTVNNMTDTFRNCPKLKIINIVFNASGVSAFNRTFDGCTSLEYVRIKGAKSSISFKDSPNIHVDSVLYVINNSDTTAIITITLHADAYARAMADASIVEALAAHTNVTLASE